MVIVVIRCALSRKPAADILFERRIVIRHQTVRPRRMWFGPMIAAKIRKRPIHHRSFSRRRWHLDQVIVRINRETHSLKRAPDHKSEMLHGFGEAALGWQNRATAPIDWRQSAPNVVNRPEPQTKNQACR